MAFSIEYQGMINAFADLRLIIHLTFLGISMKTLIKIAEYCWLKFYKWANKWSYKKLTSSAKDSTEFANFANVPNFSCKACLLRCEMLELRRDFWSDVSSTLEGAVNIIKKNYLFYTLWLKATEGKNIIWYEYFRMKLMMI